MSYAVFKGTMRFFIKDSQHLGIILIISKDSNDSNSTQCVLGDYHMPNIVLSALYGLSQIA